MNLPVRRLLMLAASLALATGCAATMPALPDTPTDNGGSYAGSAYLLSAGDTLTIAVFGQPELSGEFTVGPDGAISYPLIDEIRVEGLTAAGLEAALTDALKPDYLRSPDVSVKVQSYRPIYVVGEVTKAGSFEYQPNLSVLSAIALAGGYSYRAAKGKLTVVRSVDNEQVEIRVTETSLLKAGDTLVVPQRLF